MKKHHLIKNILAVFGAFVLCGCSVLQYTGSDYDKANVLGITTDEMLFFHTYKKDVEENITSRVGITKAQTPGISAIYISFKNDSEYPFSINTNDITITKNGKPAELITVKKFLESYYNEQNELLMTTQAFAPTIKNIANIMNNYQGENQANVIQSNNDTNASINKIESLIANFKLHSLITSATVGAGEERYFYLYIEDENEYPIIVNYKNIAWQFDKK